MKLKMLLAAGLLFATVVAHADAIATGPGAVTGSWTQNWSWTGTTIDSMTLQMISGSAWEHPMHGFTNDWTSTFFDTTTLQASGSADVDFPFLTDFVTDMSTTLSFRWFGYSQGQLIDVGVATWDGRTWSTRSEDPSAVPEPMSLALLGSGIAGVWGFRRKIRPSAA